MVFDMARAPVKASSNNGLGDLYQDSEGPHDGGCDKDFHRHEGDTTATTDVTVTNDATDRVVGTDYGTGADLGYVTDIAATTVTSVIGSSTITSIAATETIVTVVGESTVVVTATVTDPTTDININHTFHPDSRPPACIGRAAARRGYRRRVPDCLEHSSDDRISEGCSSVFRGPKAGHIITKAIETTTIAGARSRAHTGFGGHVVVPKGTVAVTSTATSQPINGITATLTTVLTTTATLSSTTSIIAPSTVLATALSTSTTLLPTITTITITTTSTSTPTTTVTVTSTRCPAAPTPHHRHRRRANARRQCPRKAGVSKRHGQ